MGSEWRLALAVPRWAGRFYVRHWKPIVGLSLLASIQRLVVVNWSVPPTIGVVSEVAVVLVRIALVVVVWRLAMRGVRVRWADVGEFATRHWRSLVCQGLLLSVAFLVFDVGLETGVSALLPDSWGQTYLAVLLFVKNPTVIAFTFVWWIGLVRQAATFREEVAV